MISQSIYATRLLQLRALLATSWMLLLFHVWMSTYLITSPKKPKDYLIFLVLPDLLVQLPF